MKDSNPDATALRDGFNLVKTLVGLPTFSVDPENGDILFALRYWKTNNPELYIFSKTVEMPSIAISNTNLVYPSASVLAGFRPIFDDWVNRMVKIAEENKEKLADHLANLKAPPGFRAASEESKNTGAPPGWHVPAPHGSLARDKQDWEQAQARKNVNFEVEAVRKNDL